MYGRHIGVNGMIKAGIIGATGYGGAELIRILHMHPHMEVTSVYSSSQEGQKITEHYPHLQDIVTEPLETIVAGKVAEQTDLVFLAVPSGISTKLSPELIEAGCKVIDLSGDFRIKNLDLYRKWYKKEPATQELVDQAIYSIPELHRENVKETSFISNPGCYPTATLLGLAPLAKAGHIVDGSIIIDAKSGVSGAGQSASFATIYNEVNESLKIYKVNQHQHIPEIEQNLQALGLQEPVTFSTHLTPMTRGIMSTIYLQLNEKFSEDELHSIYNEFYKNEPFVRVREKGNFPATKHVSGSNYCDIAITIDERTNRVTIVSVIDNLMKGAAGQAVQNANILFGLEESTGLQFSPVYP